MAPTLAETITYACVLLAAPCWAVNLALNKPADQIGSYGGAAAERAVDGQYDNDTGDDYYLSVCAHPDTTWQGHIPAKWWVDLENTYSISTVTVYNTYRQGGYWRMNNFTVDVVASDNKTTQNCGVYNKPEPVGRGSSYTFHCNNIQGRYVYITRLEGSREQDRITICEVEVDGYLMTTTTRTRTRTTTRITTRITTTTTTTTSETTTGWTSFTLGTSTPRNNTTTITLAVAIVIVIFLVVVLIIGIIFLHRRGVIRNIRLKRRKKSRMAPGMSNAGFSENASVDEESIIPTEDEIDAAKIRKVDYADHSYNDEENQYINSVIPVSEFESYINLKKEDMNISFDEYKSLPKIDHSRYTIAITDDNKKKNRFLNVYPYDLTRVILNDEYTDTEGDYINASLIKGYGNTENAYIATQGPVHQTVCDFWRMVWQYNSNRIVMAANLVEDGKRKCDQYWPKAVGQEEKYQDFTVLLGSSQECADYAIRSMKLTKGGETRLIYQYHFTSWRDKGRPLFGAVALLSFHRKVHSLDDEKTGPLIVHCSAGIGRTGTFIALDILLQQMDHERIINVYGCVQKLRQQRMLMVQTKDQFVFLHDAILEAIKVGNTTYSCSSLADELNEMCEEDENGGSDLQRQFVLLCKLKETPEEQYKEGLTEENKDKNRDLAVIPAENDRPYLSVTTDYCSHYINAVYVDSFMKHGYYIVTQMPLPNTQIDFWRLVYDHQLSYIVMLNEIDESDETCKQYWPDEGSKTYGPLNVKLMAIASISAHITMREFVVLPAPEEQGKRQHSTSKPHNVRHYQLLGWPNNEMFPPDKNVFLSLIEEVHRWQPQQNLTEDKKRKSEMIVHCLNGTTRCGLFCGVSHVIGKIKLEQEVDAMLAARYVSRRRTQFFQTQEEYKFLYDMALQFMSTCHIYSN